MEERKMGVFISVRYMRVQRSWCMSIGVVSGKACRPYTTVQIVVEDALATNYCGMMESGTVVHRGQRQWHIGWHST